MTRWAVVAIDWKTPNVVEWFDGDDAQELAEKYADVLDGMALRSVAVPEGHALIKE